MSGTQTKTVVPNQLVDLQNQVINIRDGESLFLTSFDDRNEANQAQLTYAGVVCKWKATKRLSIAIHRIPGTGAWGIFLEARKS